MLAQALGALRIMSGRGHRLLIGVVTVLWVLQASHGLEAGCQPQVEAPHLVCWRSTEHGGHSAENLQGAGNPGVSVFGHGCSSCVVGATCSFTISVLAPASWTAPSHVSQRRELNVIISGPALQAGLIQPAAVDDSSFLVTYTLWDAGLYRMSLRSSCGSLNYTTGDEQTRPHEMASWELLVHPVAEQGRRQARQGQEGEVEQGKGQGKGHERIAASVEKQPDAVSVFTPCTSRKFGRWLLQEDGKYRWTPFPCTQNKAMDPSKWVTALNKVGVREINLLGDSHQRMLTLHLRYLITGQANPSHAYVHESFSYDIQSPDGTGQLRLNFKWMDGIYTATPQSGCSQEGRGTEEPRWPQVSEAADVWVVEAGYWTGSHCKRPEAVLAESLPHFLTWTKGRMEEAARNASQVDSQQKREPLFVYRPTPPRPSEALGCEGKRTHLLTNKYVRAANSIEGVLIPQFGALLLDSWEIESARFTDTCLHNDPHYSCMSEEQPGKWAVTGVVGEADAFAFVHFILNN